MTDTRELSQQESNLYARCYGIAAFAHRHQKRKDRSTAYIHHLSHVAAELLKYNQHINVICAGVLHDILEDTDCTFEELQRLSNKEIAQLVLEVTDVATEKDGNRNARNALNSLHLFKASKEGATIKLADIHHNISDIVVTDYEFAKIYLKEKQDLLPLLKHGDINLYNRVQNTLSYQMGELVYMEKKKLQAAEQSVGKSS